MKTIIPMCTTPQTSNTDLRTPHGASKPAASHQELRRISQGRSKLAAGRLLPAGFLAFLGGLLVLATAAGAATRYVNVNNAAPAPPYTTWATAATNIQAAVDVAAAGDEILVTNGVYQTGTRAVYGMSNRVAVTKAVVVQSVNGPGVTSIVGYQVPGTTNGAAAVRCVYLTNGAVLAGFTLTNGATQAAGDPDQQRSGGGVWCESVSAVVSNCVLAANAASYYGGGAYSGTLNNCTLTGNTASSGGGACGGTFNNCTLTGNTASSSGGGAIKGTLNNCTLIGNKAGFGGGACGAYKDTINNGTLNNCTLTGNTASSYGGGAYYGTLNNCTLTGNTAYSYGGGAYYGTLNNCTLTGNTARRGGGAYKGTLNNCIVFYNSGANYYYDDGTLNYCCTTPLPGSGTGNITHAPLFADYAAGDLRLQANSPCINAGNNAYVTSATDLDGHPRIVSGTVDIGAYEFQPPAIVRQPPTQTAEIGSVASFRVWLTNAGPGTVCQWYFKGTPLAGATDASLNFANLQSAQAGSYTLVVTNVAGAVTSAPALLGVIPAVPRRAVVALSVTGEVGSLLHLEYAAALGTGSAWQALDTLTLTNPPQLYFDRSTPLPPSRFYRAWQTNTSSARPTLGLGLATELILTGLPGSTCGWTGSTSLGRQTPGFRWPP